MEKTKALVLEVEIPEWYADDLEERAELVEKDLEEDRSAAMRYLVTEEMLRPEVLISAVTLPSEKCLNSEFDLIGASGCIVGARLADA